MTLQQIYYALEIAEEGNISRTAEKLYLSQPALTNSIKELETETGITIFNRTGKGVTLTPEGKEFLMEARSLYEQYNLLADQYKPGRVIRQHFGVSTQHYTFATKAFIRLIQEYGTSEYDFAIRETGTSRVIGDVCQGESEIGILYESSYNQKVIRRLLKENNLEFHEIVTASAYVFLHSSHPLAGLESITFQDLQKYPCMRFEQEKTESSYLAEEILSDRKYQRSILVRDRATMLNLLPEVQGYTLCSGIICDELNGDGYVSIPYREDKQNKNQTMRIGYITRRGEPLDAIGLHYIDEIKKVLSL